MKSPKVVFVCQECGAQAPKWMGRCAECGAWNSLVEERAESPAGTPTTNRFSQFSTSSTARLYAEVEMSQSVRLSTGIGEFDRVLGGGKNGHRLWDRSLCQNLSHVCPVPDINNRVDRFLGWKELRRHTCPVAGKPRDMGSRPRAAIRRWSILVVGD